MIRVLIADDHAVVRRGVRDILSQAPDLELAGEAATVPELLDAARRLTWDVAVLDLNMPGGSGLDAIQVLRNQYPGRPLLVLSMNPEDQFGQRALRAGAAGYLTKESAAEELVPAIRKVLMGGRYIGPGLAELLAAQAGGAPALGHTQLSHREFEVMRLIAGGRSVSEIAEQLSLSVKTISTYRSRLLQKLGLKHNAELIRYAVDHHLA